MEPSRLLALGIFTSYFFIIIFLFCLILANLRNAKRNGSDIAVYTFTALALISFAHTWYCELQILGHSPLPIHKMIYFRHVWLHDGACS